MNSTIANLLEKTEERNDFYSYYFCFIELIKEVDIASDKLKKEFLDRALSTLEKALEFAISFNQCKIVFTEAKRLSGKKWENLVSKATERADELIKSNPVNIKIVNRENFPDVVILEDNV